MKLTARQKEVIEKIKHSGGHIGVDFEAYFIPMSGERVNATVIKNLISKSILKPSNDGLFSGFRTQTYKLKE